MAFKLCLRKEHFWPRDGPGERREVGTDLTDLGKGEDPSRLVASGGHFHHNGHWLAASLVSIPSLMFIWRATVPLPRSVRDEVSI